MSEAYIEIPTLPLAKKYFRGQYITVVENGKDLKFRLIEDAEEGSVSIKAIPDNRH